MTLHFVSMIWAAVVPELGNHLWQSTLFACAIGLLVVILRKNQARARYWLWLAASVKFLIPFSLLVVMGNHLAWPHVRAESKAGAYLAMGRVSVPFTDPIALQPTVLTPTSTAEEWGAESPALESLKGCMPTALLVVWLFGFVAVLYRWWTKWRRIAAVVREAELLSAGREVEILRRLERIEIGGVRRRIEIVASGKSMEPGVFGIIRPVLVWPKRISERLNEAHLEAVLAHEIFHVRRRDNLSAAIHMVVEAIFWFHPMVWWLGTRLVEERERACDEEVLRLCNRPQVYAESILKVCEFCVESPLACVSGVTGSDLKQRIVNIMTEHVSRKLNFARKLLLVVAGSVAVVVPVVVGVINAPAGLAQSAPTNPQDLTGMWQGTLQTDKTLRIVVKMAKGNGGWRTNMYSIDEGLGARGTGLTSLQGSNVKFLITENDGVFAGTLSADGTSIAGTWTMNAKTLPLTLVRVTEAAAWEVPMPPPPPKPMAADANPSFEVATIKPNNPDQPGRYISVRGRTFSTHNISLAALMGFVYGVHPKQIVNAPEWLDKDSYDISAVPDGEGQPNDKQWKAMLQKLLADRFKLKFHHDKKELSVFALTVAKDGPKNLTKSESAAPLPSLFFRPTPGGIMLPVKNATMADFTGVMQGAVLDRPVVDQTGLTGRFDFTLKWEPDDSQFNGHPPPPSPSNDPPPGLFTAIQQQVGLKLDAVKASADVLVIDHVEKPSEN
jgi:uncharacterized protein (TIGR03435 family)